MRIDAQHVVAIVWVALLVTIELLIHYQRNDVLSSMLEVLR